jgi:hypothetical protein
MQLFVRDTGTLVLEASEQTTIAELKAAYAARRTYGIGAEQALVSSWLIKGLWLQAPALPPACAAAAAAFHHLMAWSCLLVCMQAVHAPLDELLRTSTHNLSTYTLRPSCASTHSSLS